MNEKEKEIFRSFHYRLVTSLRAEEIAPLLYAKGVISEARQRKLFSQDNIPNANKMALLLPTVSKRCSMSVFLDCLHEAGFPFLSQNMQKQLQISYMCSDVKRQHICNTSFTEAFAEKVKVKIHNAEARNIALDIQHWINRLLNAIHREDEQRSLSQLHQQADCCFILLDSIAVIQRTHSPPHNLWKSNVYHEMESLISKTTNPIVSRIRHHARYGVALYLGDQDQKAMEYLEAAMNDAKAFLFSGRDIGNCMFALVNYRLKRLANTNSHTEKIKTLNLIEESLHFFENEDGDIRQNWRLIYLDKKASCLLALEPTGRYIRNIEISKEDLKSARECLCEMDKQIEIMDKRRKIHFYHARARLAEEESKFCIAEGYLKEAYKLCVDGGYFSELQIVKEKLNGNNVLNDNTDFTMDGIEECSNPSQAFEERPCSKIEMTDSLTRNIVTTCISDISRKLNIERSSVKRKLSESE